jgi:hypothetical protein
MNTPQTIHNSMARRQFFEGAGLRLGGLAMASMLGNQVRGDSQSMGRVHPALPGLPHFPPKAKSIIYLHMNGGPSQIDLWDYKPGLVDQFDKDLPDSIRQGQRITTMTSGQARLPVAPSKFKFAQHGQCGRWVSELLPFTSKMVDDLAVIKTVHTNAINHDPACTFVMTGSEVPGKASLGSWLSYGLGSESNDLPAFVVLTPTWSATAQAQALFTRMWSSGYLSTKHTGVALRSGGDPVLYLPNPDGVQPSDRRAMLDALRELNQERYSQLARSGDSNADRTIRDGISNANERTRLGEHRPRASEHIGNVWPRSNEAWYLCIECVAGASHGGARSASGSIASPRVGSAW